MHRRNFITASGTALAGTAATTLSPTPAARAADKPAGANERFTVGLIGPGGMGKSHLRSLVGYPDVAVAYVCDPDRNHAAGAAKLVADSTGKAPAQVADLRRVLEDKAVDAVFVATPDHWHAPATVLACQAGKHVYVEKPCSHNLREGRLMVEAARSAGVVVQTGTQSRSTAHVRQAVERLRAGVIGEVLAAKAWNSQRRGNLGKRAPEDPPAHLDFDLWLGPAPVVPYRRNLLHSVWRWWYAFGCGDIGNDGVHDIDIARWGLGVQAHPTRAVALGGKYFFDDDQEWPDTQYAAFEYAPEKPGGRSRQLVFEQRIWSPYVQEGYENGNAFYGTEGMMLLGKSGGAKIYGSRNKLVEEIAPGRPDLKAHHRNFFDCIRDGGRPTADVEIGHRSAALCHLANIATRTGRTINFDPATERVKDDPEADQLLARTYREHWAALG